MNTDLKRRLLGRGNIQIFADLSGENVVYLPVPWNSGTGVAFSVAPPGMPPTLTKEEASVSGEMLNEFSALQVRRSQ